MWFRPMRWSSRWPSLPCSCFCLSLIKSVDGPWVLFQRPVALQHDLYAYHQQGRQVILLHCNKIFSLRLWGPLGLPKRRKMNADSPFFLAPDAAIWFFGLFGDVRNIRTPGLEQGKH